ncbi:MAG: type II toxin-antitoxin system PemK/MazF family toxin [Acidobacteriota bacterium]|nr:type II toxin-antitoxin system PemK/MazF family toxin [Acidobacteriota bacterium]
MTEPARKEIWLVTLDPTTGREQAGTRPALIMSADIFNQGYAELVFVIPITSKAKNIRSHVALSPPEGGLNLPSYIMCEALRSVSKQRLLKRLGAVSAETMSEVEDRLKILFDL